MDKQVIILAAGASSRFHPFAKKTHKTMHYVCGKPLIGWTLEGLEKIGVKDIVVVVASDDTEIKQYIKENHSKTKLAYQDEPLGMGDALLAAEDMLADSFAVGFGHMVDPQVFESLWEKGDAGAKLLVDETDEPWKYGILKFDGKKAVGIVEKPDKGKEPSNTRSAGVYLLTKEYIEILKNTPQSHYNFEVALDELMKKSGVGVVEAREPVASLKYSWDLFVIRDYLLDNLPERKAKSAKIAPTATVEGKVILEEGARIFDYALIQGPVYIGKNAVVGAYSIVRDHSTLEEGAEVQRYADCTRSMFGRNSHIHSGFVGDSILGDSIRIGAGFITANRRVDRKDVEVVVKGEKVPSQSSYLGALMGDEVKVGINASTMPGVVIGKGAKIGPGTCVMENVDEDNLVYSDHRKATVAKKLE